MESTETKRVVHQLAYDWVSVELPTERLTYTDYIQTIAGLHFITDDAHQTARLFAAVIAQAQQLDYSSEWVQAKLKFEAQAVAVGDRAQWMLTDLANQDADDDSLDRYNERLNRLPNE